jgi:UDP-N-acetylglucosamine:LPS N-acetylglucosamine transferase
MDPLVMHLHEVLYISGSIGLGHVIKDLAIVNELRAVNKHVEVTWIATDPATGYLAEKGESLHPLSDKFSSYSALAEKSAGNSGLNLVNYVLASLKGWYRNVQTFRKIIRNERYDVIVGNETYEILIALVFRLLRFDTPFVIIYDFLGMDSMSKNPIERFVNFVLNLIWSTDHKFLSASNREAIFIGEPEDIPDKKFGLWMPNRREYARKHYIFVGYIIRFDPEKYTDRTVIRRNLGYDERPIIICAIGGTTIGKGMLELCNKAYPLLKTKIPGVRMILVTGPRLEPSELDVFPGVETVGFIPDLYLHFAACDLAIVQGGFSSTLELTALKRPFIFFPIEGHSEQEYVAERLKRHRAGIRMDYSRTSPESLADSVLSNFNKNVTSKTLRTDGARNTAEIIDKFLTGKPGQLRNPSWSSHYSH